MLAAGALMAGAWRYPSWFVESPPAAFAIPLCVIIYFYSIRPRHSTSLGLSIAIGAVMTKVVSLVPLAAASVGSLLESAGSKKLKIGRLAVLLLGCIVAIPLFLKFKTVITSRLFLMPSSVWEIKGHGLGFFAFSEIARDLGLLAAIVAAARSRSFRILCVVVVGAMSYWVSFMTFRWVMSATIILFAIGVLQCRVLYERSRSLVFVASALFLCATISNGFFSEERASVLFLCFWLLWVLVFPIMFCPRVDGSEADTWFGGRKRIRVKVICALAMGSVILSAVTPGIYGLLERRGKVARSQLVYEMWMTVRREVPGDGLVFVERRSGDEFVSYGRRQVFVSGRRIGGLRRDEAVMGEMERFNTDVLSGRRLPGEWPVAGEFGAFYAVLSKRRVPPAHFSLVYGNKRQRLYEIRTEGVPTDQERPPSLSERTE
jgi:hypothetical protein